MEDEINYISDKIEQVDHSIDLSMDARILGYTSGNDIEKLQREKDMLESILSKLTEKG